MSKGTIPVRVLLALIGNSAKLAFAPSIAGDHFHVATGWGGRRHVFDSGFAP